MTTDNPYTRNTPEYTGWELCYHSRDNEVEILLAEKRQAKSVCEDLRASLVKQDELVNELVAAVDFALKVFLPTVSYAEAEGIKRLRAALAKAKGE